MSSIKPRIGAVIEARMSSSRLPGKVAMDLLPGCSMTEVIVARAKTSCRLQDICVATTIESADDGFSRNLQERGIFVFRGDEDEITTRILGAADCLGLTSLVRLTGDNPFIDGALIDDVIAFYEAGGLDYVTTTHMGHSTKWAAERTWPRGICVEVINIETLRRIHQSPTDMFERIQPNAAFLERPDDFRLGAFLAEGAYADWRHPELRFTVDTAADFDFSRRVFLELCQDKGPACFSTLSAINLVLARPDLAAINADIPHASLEDVRRSHTRKRAS
ncbi:MAG: hypothetical protein HQL43_00840 [Alphaproteobacteria bacterium]|nr:hypothetical protein [Alphaproteobacteria bacterium]